MESQPDSDLDIGLLHQQFPSRDAGLYFNHAAISPWPAQTAEAVWQFATENAQLGPSRYAQWIALEKSLRGRLAGLIGADSGQDIALLKNTTEGISTVAWGLEWKEGENIVLPQAEFPSNRLPWLAQRERGVEIREVDIRAAANAETSLIAAMDARTRLLAVSSVQWSDGFRLDLQTLGSACHQRGVLFFVDAIQQLGALAMDVSSCHISFLAADAHKWLLGPEGIAVFYSQEEARSQLHLLQQGWHMFDNPWTFARTDWTPAASARRFEAGSPNSLGQVALNASLNLLLEAGMERVEHNIQDNTARMLRHLQTIPGVHLLSRAEAMRRSGIVSFRHQEMPAGSLQRGLANLGISCAVREQAIRLSPHFYQGQEEIDHACGVIRQLLEAYST